MSARRPGKRLKTRPGTRFRYSDINYLLLGEIVNQLSGEPLDKFASERIFEPLGMEHTRFRPPEEWQPRIAPTEELEDGTVLRGVVHDPTTRLMGGVAGPAGVFSTVDDLSRFARMMLQGGRLDSNRILSPLSVSNDDEFRKPPGSAHPTRSWVGFGLALLIPKRRSLSCRLLWSHRLYGNVDLGSTPPPKPT